LQWRLNCKAVSGTGGVLQVYRRVAQKGEEVFCMMANHLPSWILVLLMSQVGYCISDDFTSSGAGIQNPCSESLSHPASDLIINTWYHFSPSILPSR